MSEALTLDLLLQKLGVETSGKKQMYSKRELDFLLIDYRASHHTNSFWLFNGPVLISNGLSVFPSFSVGLPTKIDVNALGDVNASFDLINGESILVTNLTRIGKQEDQCGWMLENNLGEKLLLVTHSDPFNM